MQSAIYVTAIALILTKLADVVSTLQHIRGATHESNRIARHIMQRIGIAPTVWLIFGVSIGIIALATYFALESHWLMQLTFVVVGTLVALVQAAVAHANTTQRENHIVSLVRRILYAWYGRT